MQDMLSEELDEAAVLRSAEIQRFRVFNERCILGAVIAPAGIGLLAWVLWTANGALPALTWTALIGVVELTILGVGLRGRRSVNETDRFDTWKSVQCTLAAVGGMTWGLAVWFVWRPGEGLFYLATLTMLVAVAGVSMVTMASYGAASLLFFGGIYLVPLLHSFLHPVPTSAQIQVGLLVGWLVQLTYTRELGRVVVRDAHQFAHNEALVHRLNELDQYDQLTGAHTRRHTFSCMEQLVASQQRHGTPAAAVMFDLDHF